MATMADRQHATRAYGQAGRHDKEKMPMTDEKDRCRICEVARATGEDGLCDGCRGARTLARAEQTGSKHDN